MTETKQKRKPPFIHYISEADFGGLRKKKWLYNIRHKRKTAAMANRYMRRSAISAGGRAA